MSGKLKSINMRNGDYEYNPDNGTGLSLIHI